LAADAVVSGEMGARLFNAANHLENACLDLHWAVLAAPAEEEVE